VSKVKIKHPSEFHLVWDSYTPYLAHGGNFATGFKPSLMTWSASAGSPHRANIWRHSPRAAQGDFKRGPNVLFADGHCEPRVNIFDITDYNATLPPK
jgi:prepilin-type processing-associated H-X9-DG protein